MHRFRPSPASFKHSRDQIDRFALQIFAEMLVPSQFPALVSGQQADDVVRNAFSGEGRSREMAEIVNPQSIYAASFATRRNRFPKSHACGLLKLPLNRGLGLAGKTYSWWP